MHPRKLPIGAATATLALLSFAQAQFLINDLSFGYNGKISQDRSGTIPNFHLQGSPNHPEVMSNKLILTPVAPGNHRGAVWADNELKHESWVADVDFRVNGPERGGGNLNIWLAHRGPSDVAASSIYTIRRFQGLALVVDTHGGTGGMIRGFLNDGSVDYTTRSNIDELAFGNCYYSYRNLGRPSQIKLRQEPNLFKVEIDGRLCFESDKIQIPTGYKFGITAATPDNPDSFEIFKLVVMADSLHGLSHHEDTGSAAPPPPPKEPQGNARTSPQKTFLQSNDAAIDDPYDNSIPDVEADTIVSSKAQFRDLHNRLQSTNHHASTIFRAVSKSLQIGEKRHEELSKMLSDIRSDLRRLDTINDLQNKVVSLEKEVKSLRNDLSSKMRDSEKALKSFMSDHHSTLSENIHKAAPGHGRLIFVIVGSQVVLAVGYVLYKRRKSSPSKKYL